jgi:hypothetical protein
MLDPGPNPVLESELDQELKPEYITVPVLVPMRQKFVVLVVTAQVTAPIHNTA